MRIAVIGCPRSGTSMFYTMLKNTVTNWGFYESERPVNHCDEGHVSKRPMDVESGPVDGVTYIVVVRDPRDIMCSVHKNAKGFFIDADFCQVVGGGRTQPGVAEIFKKFDDYEGHVFIHYEDLVTNPWDVQDRLKAELGFDYSGDFAYAWQDGAPKGMEVALNGLRPPDTDSIGKWKQHPERIAEQFGKRPELFDYLIRYGYEKDRTWVKHLHLPLPA